MAKFESLRGHSYGGNEKNHEDTQRSPAEILTASNPKTNELMSAANCWVYIVLKHKFQKTHRIKWRRIVVI